jgi:hypothetical protein
MEEKELRIADCGLRISTKLDWSDGVMGKPNTQTLKLQHSNTPTLQLTLEMLQKLAPVPGPFFQPGGLALASGQEIEWLK